MSNVSYFSASDYLATRIFDEEEHEFRSKFERDRDRILYSKAFRRLSGKTQVFFVGNDDHIRTRLTHTLEVVQISSTISKKLGLNLPLTEAIAYGHDLGHTPFGHVGERTLNYIMNGCYSIREFNRNIDNKELGFKHNWQSIRVLSELELLNKDYFGLNPTDYTLWGIVYHSSLKYKPCNRKTKDNKCNLRLYGNPCIKANGNELGLGFYDRYSKVINEQAWNLEGLVVAMADEIAQRHHDIEDGIEAGIIDKNELISKFNVEFSEFLKEHEKLLAAKIKKEKDKKYYLPMFSKLIVNFLTTKIIVDTETMLKSISERFDITSNEDFLCKRESILDEFDIKKLVAYSEDFIKKEENFQKYLKNRILNSHKAQSMDGKAGYIIRRLFKAYVSNPQQLPDKTIEAIYRMKMNNEEFEKFKDDLSDTELSGKLRDKLEEDHYNISDRNYKTVLLRTICNYISGMTDKYALEQFSSLYES